MDSQLIQDAKLNMAEEMNKDNVPERNTETQDRPPKPSKRIPHNSDWSDSEDGKDAQARASSTDIQDPKPSTSFASYAS